METENRNTTKRISVNMETRQCCYRQPLSLSGGTSNSFLLLFGSDRFTTRSTLHLKFVSAAMKIDSLSFRVIYQGYFFSFSTNHSNHPPPGTITLPSRNMRRKQRPV